MGTPDKYAAIKEWRELMEYMVFRYGASAEEARFAQSDEPWLDLGGEA